jgi:hypothetical protein
MNVSLTKRFSFTERIQLQSRAESFDLCNHVPFGPASVTPTSAAFGTISNQTNTRRVIQCALRLTF